jgi:hypothetical protein
MYLRFGVDSLITIFAISSITKEHLTQKARVSLPKMSCGDCKGEDEDNKIRNYI